MQHFLLSIFSKISFLPLLFNSRAMFHSILVHLHVTGGSDGKGSTSNVRDLGLIPGLGRFSWRRTWQSTLAFLPEEPPWIEEPGGLQSMGLHRVGHD